MLFMPIFEDYFSLLSFLPISFYQRNEWKKTKYLGRTLEYRTSSALRSDLVPRDESNNVNVNVAEDESTHAPLATVTSLR